MYLKSIVEGKCGFGPSEATLFKIMVKLKEFQRVCADVFFIGLSNKQKLEVFLRDTLSSVLMHGHFLPFILPLSNLASSVCLLKV